MKNKVILLVGFIGLSALLYARPPQPVGGSFPPPRVPGRPQWRAEPRHEPKWGFGLNLTPWGGAIGFGTRVGRHGAIGVSLPLFAPPPPVIRETQTVVIQQPAVIQQPVVVQPITAQPEVAESATAILPAYRSTSSPTQSGAKTWVEGYWRVTRTPEGLETDRVWVPGHWE